MPISERTKTTISGANKIEEQLCTFAFDPGATAVYRISEDEVPRTSADITKLFEWEFGDTVRGTHAKEHEGMKRYRKDIDSAYGKESDYDKNMIFVDTISEKNLVSDQLKELKA
uniref:Uncharacterized protein n=1 Tax=viral metagenome TaxID=1070528 RepID=A0A6H1ZLV4_9ZZZZ